MQPQHRAGIVCTLAGLFCLAFLTAAWLVAAAEHPVKARESSITEHEEADDCADCHEKEVDGFARSKMAQSMRLPADEPQGTVQIPGTAIRMYSNREGVWQRLESQGWTETFRVAYVIGSGTHANGYIVSLANHLYQSPVAYYRHRSAYGLAPGYEHEPNPDFTRPIEPGCLFCHAGSFTPVSGTANEYAPKPFVHLAITCSRCHGPVDAHLRHPGASNIVNPARLDADARDSVCEQCHLKGVARVLNPGKRFEDFVPGKPLEATFTIYRYAMPEGAEPPFKVISQSEQLALSRCKRASGTKLWCGTCHDPHNEPVDPVAYYRAKCLVCHAATHFAADHPSKQSNCIGCHMPKTETTDGGHTVFTDHRIQAAKSDMPAVEPVGIVPWRDPPADLAERNLGIASIDAGMEQKSQSQIVNGYRILANLQNHPAEDSGMYEAMGTALFLGKQYAEAAKAFELAVHGAPRSSPDEASLGSAYAALGRNDLAEVHLERAVDLDPLNLGAAETLLGIYVQTGEQAKADTLRRKLAQLIPLN